MARQELDPALLLEMGQVVRREILKSYARDSCIATVAATVQALRQLHVSAFALTVDLTIVNRPLYETAERLGQYPEIGSPEYPEGGYGLAFRAQEGEVSHVVAIAERTYLLDFSLDQASRPEYGIELAPIVIPVQEPFLRGRGHLAYRYGDTFLYYHARPQDRTFERSANWVGNDHAPHVHVKRTSKNGRDR